MLDISTCEDEATVPRNVRIQLACGTASHPERTESSATSLSKPRDQQRGHKPLLHSIFKQSESFAEAKQLVAEVTETLSANCMRVMNLERFL